MDTKRACLHGSLVLLVLSLASAHLAADTQVSLADGTRKQLREIRLGDEVLSYNEASRAVASATVVAIFEAWLPLEQLADVRLGGLSADVESQSRHLRSAAAASAEAGLGALGASGARGALDSSSSGLIVTHDQPIYSARAQGMVSMDPAATFQHYGLRVGQMQPLELLRPHTGLPLEAAVGNWSRRPAMQTNMNMKMNMSRVMTLHLERHHWFFAEGVLVHNKGVGGGGGGPAAAAPAPVSTAGQEGGGGGGGGGGDPAASIAGIAGGTAGLLGLIGVVGLLHYYKPCEDTIVLLTDIEASQTGLPPALRLSLSGLYTENEQNYFCRYELDLQEGLISGKGKDGDGPAQVEGKVRYLQGAQEGIIIWTERLPEKATMPAVTIQFQGSLSPAHGKWQIIGKYISDYRNTRGTLQLEGSGMEVEPKPTATATPQPVVVGGDSNASPVVVPEPSAGNEDSNSNSDSLPGVKGPAVLV